MFDELLKRLNGLTADEIRTQYANDPLFHATERDIKTNILNAAIIGKATNDQWVYVDKQGWKAPVLNTAETNALTNTALAIAEAFPNMLKHEKSRLSSFHVAADYGNTDVLVPLMRAHPAIFDEVNTYENRVLFCAIDRHHTVKDPAIVEKTVLAMLKERPDLLQQTGRDTPNRIADVAKYTDMGEENTILHILAGNGHAELASHLAETDRVLAHKINGEGNNFLHLIFTPLLNISEWGVGAKEKQNFTDAQHFLKITSKQHAAALMVAKKYPNLLLVKNGHGREDDLEQQPVDLMLNQLLAISEKVLGSGQFQQAKIYNEQFIQKHSATKDLSNQPLLQAEVNLAQTYVSAREFLMRQPGLSAWYYNQERKLRNDPAVSNFIVEAHNDQIIGRQNAKIGMLSFAKIRLPAELKHMIYNFLSNDTFSTKIGLSIDKMHKLGEVYATYQEASIDTHLTQTYSRRKGGDTDLIKQKGNTNSRIKGTHINREMARKRTTLFKHLKYGLEPIIEDYDRITRPIKAKKAGTLKFRQLVGSSKERDSAPKNRAQKVSTGHTR